MKLLLPLDSRLCETQGFAVLDTEGRGSFLQRTTETLPYVRKGFRGACLVRSGLLAVVTSCALKFYQITCSTDGEAQFQLIRQIHQPEWLLGRGANADLHIPWMDPVSGELWIANSYMDCIDRFTPQGDFIARRFLWEISPAIDKLAQTRNRQAADLCHLNYFDSIGTDRVAMLGNLNGTGKGALLSLESGELLLEGLGRPHDGVWHEGDFFVTETSRYQLLAYKNIAKAEDIRNCPPQVIDLRHDTNVAEDNRFWLRGLHLTSDRIYVGCSQFQDRDTGQAGIIPSQVIEIERSSGTILRRLDVPQSKELAQPVIYSLLDFESLF